MVNILGFTLGIILAFVVIILLIRRRFNFGASLILGALLLGFFSLQIAQYIEIPKALLEATFYSFSAQRIITDPLELAILMTLIYVLAKSMQETGSIQQLINSLRTFFSKGGTLAVIPAIYGLMPGPGGALFSAPMVDEEGNKYQLDNNKKNLLNVWFRHIWFPIYPVTPAMILICSEQFSNLNIYLLALVGIPAFLASLIVGGIFLKKFIQHYPQQHISTKKDFHGLVFLLPPVIPLVFYAVLQLFGFPQTRSFLVGILGSILLLFFLTKLPWKEFLHILKKSLTWKLAFAIFGILIFTKMFEVSIIGSGANSAIIALFGHLALPFLLVVIVISFFLGALTGSDLMAITLSYSLVSPFLSVININLLGITSIIYVSSLIGYLISPIHLCNVLSSEYLKTDTTRMYKLFIPAALFVLLLQCIFIVIFFGI